MLAVAADHFGVTRTLTLLSFRREQLGVAEDRRERRAQLVAHVSEEGALRLVRRMGCALCALCLSRGQRQSLCMGAQLVARRERGNEVSKEHPALQLHEREKQGNSRSDAPALSHLQREHGHEQRGEHADQVSTQERQVGIERGDGASGDARGGNQHDDAIRVEPEGERDRRAAAPDTPLQQRAYAEVPRPALRSARVERGMARNDDQAKHREDQRPQRQTQLPRVRIGGGLNGRNHQHGEHEGSHDAGP